MNEPSSSSCLSLQNKGAVDSKKILPPIKSTNRVMDCLPDNLLSTLTQAVAKFDDLGPGSRRKVKRVNKKIDNAWNHESTRLKFKHLTEQPVCYCGAGRDISYLLDAKSKRYQEKKDITHNTTHNTDGDISNKNAIPESIVPAEFHIVKHSGVVGLDIHEEKYTTKAGNHEDHLTVFPSMKPSGRQEAVQLMKTMNVLLKRAGADSPLVEENQNFFDETGGNQIENLVNIVKNEQKIYNIVFNEIIRQVSIECAERGAVLAELRKRYANMLDRIPKQVKSLHEEVLAQRALDRRLTEELARFKASVTVLTKELYEIHAHDEVVTKQAIETEAELNKALKESEKNARLLAEYHDLYELQRRRLDYQLSKLMEERDLWAGSAHTLSLKVTEKHNLVTVSRLHLHGKAWYKIANRFVVMLGQEDEKHLHLLASNVHRWQDIVDSFNERLLKAEQETCRKMKEIQQTLKTWGKAFERVVTPDEGKVHPLQTTEVGDLHKTLKSWEETFNAEAERFSGDTLLACEDDLLQLNALVDKWIETSLKLFANHPTENGEMHQQHVAMVTLNRKIENLHQDFKIRMNGEHGLSDNIFRFINSLATWINKLDVLLHGGEPLYDSEWVQLSDFLQVQWQDIVNKIISILSPEDAEINILSISPFPASPVSVVVKERADPDEVYEAAQAWLNEIIDTFEIENGNMIEQVTTTHSNMIRWMITVLIRLAPDTIDKNTPDDTPEEDKYTGLGAAILFEATSAAVTDRATMLFNWIRSLTDLILSCCKEITKKDSDEEIIDQKEVIVKKLDLKKIEEECQGWMHTANLLIQELTGTTIPMKDFLPNTKNKLLKGVNEDTIASSSLSSKTETSDVITDADTFEEKRQDSVLAESEKKENISIESANLDEPQEVESTQLDKTLLVVKDHSAPVMSQRDIASIFESKTSEMHIIGHDENVKRINIQQEENTETAFDKDATQSTLSKELLSTLEKLRGQLLQTEERAQKAEERAFQAESALKEAEERIRALERSLTRAESRSEMNHGEV